MLKSVDPAVLEAMKLPSKWEKLKYLERAKVAHSDATITTLFNRMLRRLHHYFWRKFSKAGLCAQRHKTDIVFIFFANSEIF